MKSYRVAHILVKAKYEAEDLLLKLKKDQNLFHDLARKFSICSSAKNGGDLGEIKPGKAAEEFEEAAMNLAENEITEKPVRTQFGYHIIKKLK